MPEFWIVFVLVGGVYASLMFWIALRMRLMALVDLVWTSALALGAFGYAFVNDLVYAETIPVLAVLLIWSLRLSYHLFQHRILPGKEDPRYVRLATYWGQRQVGYFYGLFLSQVVFAGLFLLPVVVALESAACACGARVLGLLIALIALLGESIADQQLAVFRQDPANAKRVCKTGLWRYSRHPNYFFEWVYWWAYVAFSWGSANWWVSLVGPAAMYCFLRYLTGIPHAERSSIARCGDAYLRYQKQTNMLIPWKPRNLPTSSVPT
ncbi:DUF1295 domain-containing protein [Coraliomargarita akajimensis]|uniref:Uncharacterized protein n=1 Tax=Coraliomargarita akajimensis (strain DSM 45221 / IAM 15411 / JCM 23193 / KCTC 12865 / 04OKA010-24) TaxID=583355 RepID=D5EJE9_CORAD|nr:DUF1295 domain-containing protein [Coraliomargarita akajimensis]ADE54548.1 protein of unknown function DUF1295 [Coraliomargarita akajimensis DSM 45221]